VIKIESSVPPRALPAPPVAQLGSAASNFVKHEWQFALGLNRHLFVRPIYWQEPMPPPPDELNQFHFHRFEIASEAFGAASPESMQGCASAPPTLRSQPLFMPSTDIQRGVAPLCDPDERLPSSVVRRKGGLALPIKLFLLVLGLVALAVFLFFWR
jgi:hypothetical protein